jgi:uncharacterized membrane protein
LIELGDLFKNCIPVDFMMTLPRKFVQRLREVRKYQRELREKSQQAQMNQANNNPSAAARIPGFDSTAIEDAIQELS